MPKEQTNQLAVFFAMIALKGLRAGETMAHLGAHLAAQSSRVSALKQVPFSDEERSGPPTLSANSVLYIRLHLLPEGQIG